MVLQEDLVCLHLHKVTEFLFQQQAFERSASDGGVIIICCGYAELSMRVSAVLCCAVLAVITASMSRLGTRSRISRSLSFFILSDMLTVPSFLDCRFSAFLTADWHSA